MQNRNKNTLMIIESEKINKELYVHIHINSEMTKAEKTLFMQSLATAITQMSDKGGVLEGMLPND